MKTSPTVTLNTNEFIKANFGLYNRENAQIIWAIADNEKELLKGCVSMRGYHARLTECVNRQ